MAATTLDRPYRVPHPLHISLVVSTVPLFLGSLLSDLAYGSTFQVQWKNFASWLIVGGLVLAGLALLWAVVDTLRADSRADWRRWLHPFLVLATFAIGFINALIHAKDVWASMPDGLILSAIVVVLAVAATWIGFSTLREGATR